MLFIPYIFSIPMLCKIYLRDGSLYDRVGKKPPGLWNFFLPKRRGLCFFLQQNGRVMKKCWINLKLTQETWQFFGIYKTRNLYSNTRGPIFFNVSHAGMFICAGTYHASENCKVSVVTNQWRLEFSFKM